MSAADRNKKVPVYLYASRSGNLIAMTAKAIFKVIAEELH
jgi:hypothetical protein